MAQMKDSGFLTEIPAKKRHRYSESKENQADTRNGAGGNWENGINALEEDR
jgi:hypothetical protein